MKRFICLLLTLVMVIVLAMTFVSWHPGNNTQADMPVMAAAATSEMLTPGFTVSSTVSRNTTSYEVIYWAILLLTLTAIEVAVVACRKQIIQWKTSARRLCLSLKARIRGALAGGTQLKFPMLA